MVMSWLRNETARLGLDSNVSWAGFLAGEQKASAYAQADVFVLPSYAEGLPMALLEAMAWGLPAICTPVGSIPKQVHDGVEGFLVQPGDVAHLARAIERIVGDDALRARMAVAARATVEPLSVDLFVEAVVALYGSLAPDASGGTRGE